MSTHTVVRWTTLSRVTAMGAVFLLVIGLAGPFALDGSSLEKLTTLFIYVILAVTWNAMAGYGGLVSIGQQAFFGLGAYLAVRLSTAGMPVYPALLAASAIVALLSLPLSFVMLRLRAGELAIGMWVVAELAHLLVNLDGHIQGATGTSLVAVDRYAPAARHAANYWMALFAMSVVLFGLFALLRSRRGVAIQAIRDDEDTAASLGVRVLETKRVIFIFAASGTGLAGALWLASAISFQPNTYFGVQWTAYMIFMVLVGGIGTFEGPIAGAVIFFAIENWFGSAGVWYLVGLGGTALLFSLFAPSGIWGFLESRQMPQFLAVGYDVRSTLPQRAKVP